MPASNQALRLFIGIPLTTSALVKIRELLGLLQPKGQDVKWVPAENVHLTLKFLGDRPSAMVPDLRKAIDRVASAHQAVHTLINSVKAFPNFVRPRVIWAGFDNGVDQLVTLATALEKELLPLGIEAEKRKFAAHLTLGRVRQGKRIDRLAEYLVDFHLEPFDIPFERIVLFKSTLTPSGAIYERLHERIISSDLFSG